MNNKRTGCALLGCAAVALLATGCAEIPSNAGENPADPWEAMNRHVWSFNDGIDRAVLKPAAQGYVNVTPEIVRSGVSNAFDNLFTPSHVLNNTLQGKVDDGIGSVFRFLVNTTFGIGGLFDVASRIGLEAKPEDFGQTLAVWGVPSGPYVVLPFLGPSTTRDMWRYAEEFGTNPLTYALWHEDWYWSTGIGALTVVEARARLLPLEDIRKNTVDDYVAVRDAYLAQRRLLANDGEVDETEELRSLTALPVDDEE